VDVHFVLDRPHLNDGARILRLKPRYNEDVNQWWMCDEGRFGFGWIDRGRLTKLRHHGTESTWDQAMSEIGTSLSKIGPIAVIASSQLTTEELFLIRRIFQEGLGARVTAPALRPPGASDDFLIQADKNPNTLGATLLGLGGKGAPDAGVLVEEALEGRIEALWVFGHDLTALIGEDKLKELSKKLRLFVFSGTNESPMTAWSHWVLPTAAYVEKDGTFVNCDGRVQRIGRAFPPLDGSREDWRVLLDVARSLNQSVTWGKPQEIFLALAEAVKPFAGLSYEKIGPRGARVPLP
jgi:NADH-quinone oxidoreductase subunit G